MVPAEESNQFRFTVNDLKRRITKRTKLIIINSPQNPTGGVLTLKDLMGVAELANEHDLLILSDEIYGKIFYEQRPPSMLDVPGILALKGPGRSGELTRRSCYIGGSSPIDRDCGA